MSKNGQAANAATMMTSCRWRLFRLLEERTPEVLWRKSNFPTSFRPYSTKRVIQPDLSKVQPLHHYHMPIIHHG